MFPSTEKLLKLVLYYVGESIVSEIHFSGESYPDENFIVHAPADPIKNPFIYLPLNKNTTANPYL
jgi:hypothetical protein